MTTTTNPSLAVDNDAERIFKAFRDAHIAIDKFDTEYSQQLGILARENARLRAALTEAERDPGDGYTAIAAALNDEISNLQAELNKERGARARLAKELDEEIARTPRLRQEQTAEIERLKGVVDGLTYTRDGRLASVVGERDARIVELEAEVAELKASRYGPPDPFDPEHAPAAPAVAVVEVGSRWAQKFSGKPVLVTDGVVYETQRVTFHLSRTDFLDLYTRIPDEPAGGGEP